MDDEIRAAVEETGANTETPDNPETAAGAAEQWAGEKAELEDLLRRRQAEFENYRRRVERERAEFVEYAAMESVRALLPTLDDFERALQAAESVAAAEDEFVRGFELIYKRLLETLTRQGLEPIQAQGQPFDPHVHEAVQRVEEEGAEDGTILEEYQRGYTYKGRLLRPSMVKVAVRS
jgi:molecular chaperone GrpE